MTTGLAVFDHTVQETNLLLKAIEEELGADTRHQAYSAARGVLHALRDQLPTDSVAQLSAQMPMLLRGLFLEGWKPNASPPPCSDDAFLDRVAGELPQGFPFTTESTIRAVFRVLWQRMDPGEVDQAIERLPKRIRAFWPLHAPA